MDCRWIVDVVHRSNRSAVVAPPAAYHGAVLSFACPRCSTEVQEEFYGPCTPCRHTLRAEQGTDPVGTVTETAYEPKMNVTPNAVALKE